MTVTVLPPAVSARPIRRGVPRLYLRLEVVRALRNPWTVGFSILMPAALYLLFGAGPSYGDEPTAHGTVSGIVMANMALYGAMMAATNVAGSVSEERGAGWNRQLRLTPLRSVVYVGAKVLAAAVVGALVVTTTFTVGYASGAKLEMPYAMWAFLLCWLGGTTMFAAFGLAVGYLFRGEAVLGVAGPLLSFFAFFGGLFVPLDQLGDVMETVGRFTPMYGVRSLLESLLTDGVIEPLAVWGALAWTVLFVAVAAFRYRKVAGRE